MNCPHCGKDIVVKLESPNKGRRAYFHDQYIKRKIKKFEEQKKQGATK